MSGAASVASAVTKTHKLFTLVLLARPRASTHTLRTPPPAKANAISSASPAEPTASLFPSPCPYTHVLLGLKKRGFGTGKWNGFGGKVEANENIRQAAVREMKEEAGIDLLPSQLSHRAVLLQEFEHDPTILEIHVFLALKPDVEQETPVESDEMRPAWFRVEPEPTDSKVPNDEMRAATPADATVGIPLHTMWLDDAHWYPWAFADQRFRGYFLFRGQDLIVQHEVRPATDEERREMEKEEDAL